MAFEQVVMCCRLWALYTVHPNRPLRYAFSLSNADLTKSRASVLGRFAFSTALIAIDAISNSNTRTEGGEERKNIKGRESECGKIACSEKAETRRAICQ